MRGGAPIGCLTIRRHVLDATSEAERRGHSAKRAETSVTCSGEGDLPSRHLLAGHEHRERFLLGDRLQRDRCRKEI